MDNKQQTALQKLIQFTKEQIELQTIELEYYTKIGSISLKQRYHYTIEGLQMALNEMEKHLEIEKRQIIEAHAVGRIKQCSGIMTDGEQYYNETYEQTNRN